MLDGCLCVFLAAAWMPGSMTLTNPGLESLKAGGPLSEDLFAGDAPVSRNTGMLSLPDEPNASRPGLQVLKPNGHLSQ